MYTIKHAGLVIEIMPDTDPMNPRKDCEPLGHMLCVHKRYNLGDNYKIALEEIIEISENQDNLCLPLYLYDHSGITMSTKSFNCPWDSGQVGIIYMTNKEIQEEFNGNTEQARKSLISEVETYDLYLRGDVWGYTILDQSGESLDSCCGFFGYDYCVSEAKNAAEYCANKEQVAQKFYLNGL